MDRDQMLKVLVPVGGLAVLLILVAAVIALTDPSAPTPGSGDANAPPTPPERSKMLEPEDPAAASPDKFDFPLDGPEWKDIGGGLKVWDVKEGYGAVCPTLAQRPGVIPKMHYTGWLTTGLQFDSSRKPGKAPLEMALSGLVDGWKRGVPGMKVGGRRRLVIPSDLGYGPQGRPPYIPGGATLVFEMELLDVK